MKKTIPLKIPTRTKDLGINVTKEVKDIYTLKTVRH